MRPTKKHGTAFLYAIQVPLAVWAGIRLDQQDWFFAGVLIFAATCIEFAASVNWMDAQTEQTIAGIKEAK
jgi:hypothetical protein